MNDSITVQLSEQIAICSGGVCHILLPHYAESVRGDDSAIIESYGFLLAFLYDNQALNINECGECIACFVGTHIGSDVESFHAIAKAVHFYSKWLKLIDNSPSDVFAISVILYNLLHPRSQSECDSPKQFLSMMDLNIAECFELWLKIRDFLTEVLPNRVNPILSKIS